MVMSWAELVDRVGWRTIHARQAAQSARGRVHDPLVPHLLSKILSLIWMIVMNSIRRSTASKEPLDYPARSVRPGLRP
jgi:hypothetical protein